MKRWVLYLLMVTQPIISDQFMYFCTGANAAYYHRLLNLIGCLHKVNFDEIVEIAVFDLGLEQYQLDKLKTIKKVKIYNIEKIHPDILKPVQICPGKYVPGWYAWKPVAIKQALDMFPYVLWIDAGTIILKSLDNAFKHIIQNGYMLLHGGPHPLHRHTTKYVINKFNLTSAERRWILDAPSIAAFWIGVTQQMGEKLIKPIYALASDLTNFQDDGSSTLGFGAARYEQTLISIQAHLMGLTIFYTSNPIVLKVDGKEVLFYATWESSKYHANKALYDVYYQVRDALGFDKYIRF